MTTVLFSKDDWKKALLGLNAKVFVPVKEGDYAGFQRLTEGVNPDWSYQNTRMSPKAIVYPQSERMFEYSLDESDPQAHVLKEAAKDFGPQVVVGIRPCDAHAFQIVKRNFDNQEFRDPWWVKRYEATTFVGLGCAEPCSTCFCVSAGGGPFGKIGLDVMLYDVGDGFTAVSLTPKGDDFLKGLKGGKAGGDKEKAIVKGLEDKAAGKVSSRISTDKLKDKVVNQLFGAPFWDNVAFSCINCGTCTYLCPTCWCFDIQDEVFGKQGDRIRNWDSCMFPLFTLHGSGHNPRDKKTARVRQRFMHKLKYYVDKYGDGIQCSGCGRCVRYCPVNIDIRQVAELMNNY
jgi:ferredoxin